MVSFRMDAVDSARGHPFGYGAGYSVVFVLNAC